MFANPAHTAQPGHGQGRKGDKCWGPMRQVILGGFQHRRRAGKGFQAVHGKLCGQPPYLQASSYPRPSKAP